MMNPRRFLRHASRLCLSLCLWAPAARALDFRVLSWSGSPAGLHVSAGPGAKTIPLRAAEDVLSPMLHAPAGAVLKLFRSADTGEPPLAVLTPPPEMERAILVLVPASAPGAAYAGLWLDDSPEARPDNSITLHNLSAAPVALQLGPAQALLRPGERHVRRFTADERTVMIQAAIPRGDGWERVVSSPQPVKTGFRILVILRDGRRRAEGDKDALDLVTLYDYRKPQALAATR